MAGMAEVGRLFNANELIVAEVLQSAEAMKASVNHLEQFMEKADTAKRGKIVLATVKGDVHDIGKNLVEIILKNNGYDVVNLGIKVPPEELIKAYLQHHPDAIGLSGLLVKSAQQMVITASDLREAGIMIPLSGGRGGFICEIYADKDCAELWPGRLLRERCDDWIAVDEPADGSGDAGTGSARARGVGNGVAVATTVAVAEMPQGRAFAESAHGSADSEGGVSRSKSAASAGFERAVELHQSVHVVLPAHGVSRGFREAACAARSKGGRAI